MVGAVDSVALVLASLLKSGFEGVRPPFSVDLESYGKISKTGRVGSINRAKEEAHTGRCHFSVS